MPFVRVVQRPVIVRAPIPNQPIGPRMPMAQQPQQPRAIVRNNPPAVRTAPVLHPPMYNPEYGYAEEAEQQYGYEELHTYRTVFLPDQHGGFTQRFSTYPTFGYYPQRQLTHRVRPHFY